jgi:alkylation response protein AidB-like acyl-CoA dehydrogenase
VQLRDSEADAEFRSRARAWLADAVPTLPPEPDPTDWPARRARDTPWQRLLFDAGYAGINWPAEYGGRGATPTEHLIFLEEAARAGAPDVGVGFVGQMHAGPTLIAEGTPEQQAHHLRGILTGDHVWCQGFSEPEAGSDLASLRTRAVRDGDHYVITGQKIWTSHAQVADYCEMLVRTDPDAPKHKGITWLIVPMDSPGIEVRPLVTVQGSAEFAELFLDEVRVPVANRVGAENDGWRVANVTLSFERGTGFVGEMLETTRLHGELVRIAQQVPRGTGTAWDDVGLRREFGALAAELDALWAFTKRNVSAGERGGIPISGGSGFKLAYGALVHRLGDLALRVLDRASLSFDDIGDLPTGAQVHGKLHGFGVSTGGGTSQIQQNILAERVLGLPREAR